LTAVLLANAAATLFMVGVTWFVQVVHYPLFAAVGASEFRHYHLEHTRRTTGVVVAPMLVELVSSFVLVAEPPGGETELAVVGAALAALIWALTFGGAVPAHRRLGDATSMAPLTGLIRVSLIRTVAWTAHGAVVIALLATEL
jgi:hypothetical protein